MSESPFRDQALWILQNPDAAIIAQLANLYSIYDCAWWNHARQQVAGRLPSYTTEDVVKEYEDEKQRNPR